jgi:CHAD domain-containing protein
MTKADRSRLAERPVSAHLATLLRPRIDQVWTAAKHLDDPARVEDHHALRIAVKGLRYELETWSPCLPPRLRKAAEALKGLQDLLGELHDHDVRADQLVGLLAAHGDAIRQSLGRVAGHGAAHRELPAAALSVAHLAEDVPLKGLSRILADAGRRRTELHGRVVEAWAELQARRLRRKLLKALPEAA